MQCLLTSLGLRHCFFIEMSAVSKYWEKVVSSPRLASAVRGKALAANEFGPFSITHKSYASREVPKKKEEREEEKHIKV